jgi:hypothetical protein
MARACGSVPSGRYRELVADDVDGGHGGEKVAVGGAFAQFVEPGVGVARLECRVCRGIELEQCLGQGQVAQDRWDRGWLDR